MNKQDRNGVRTPMELERKYNFGLVFGDNPNSYQKMIEKVGKLSEDTEGLELRLLLEFERRLGEIAEVFDQRIMEV